jgi:HD-GYP domain-containing protein (c-di-GMP phosphodiesterase class II)
VADVYDALTSDRPYRAALTHNACLDVLRQDAAGGGLDPDLVEQFCSIPADHFTGADPVLLPDQHRVVPAGVGAEAAV